MEQTFVQISAQADWLAGRHKHADTLWPSANSNWVRRAAAVRRLHFAALGRLRTARGLCLVCKWGRPAAQKAQRADKSAHGGNRRPARSARLVRVACARALHRHAAPSGSARAQADARTASMQPPPPPPPPSMAAVTRGGPRAAFPRRQTGLPDGAPARWWQTRKLANGQPACLPGRLPTAPGHLLLCRLLGVGVAQSRPLYNQIARPPSQPAGEPGRGPFGHGRGPAPIDARSRADALEAAAQLLSLCPIGAFPVGAARSAGRWPTC